MTPDPLRPDEEGGADVTVDLLPLLVPVAFLLLALPFGLRSRALDRRVRALYLFHESGDPLAMVSSDELPPIPAEDLEPVLATIREFVEADGATNRGMVVRKTRFGEEGLVAVRGQHVSACAVFRSQADGVILRDLTRFVRAFEAQNGTRLGTWEEATHLGDTLSGALRSLMTGRSDQDLTPNLAVAARA